MTRRKGQSSGFEVIAGAVIGVVVLGVAAGFGDAWRPVKRGDAVGMAGMFAFPSPSPVTPARVAADQPAGVSPEPPRDVPQPLVPDPRVAASPSRGTPSRDTSPRDRSTGDVRQGGVEPGPSPMAGDTPRRAPPVANLAAPGFRRAAEAAEKSDPSAAVVIIEDFRASNPDPLYRPHLDDLVDIALDRLYWQRVTQLVAQRQETSRRISELRVEHSRQSDAAARRQINERIEDLRKSLTQTAEALGSMGYSGTAAPPLTDPVAMESLRQRRDSGQFATWKNRVRLTLIRTRGTPPWGIRS